MKVLKMIGIYTISSTVLLVGVILGMWIAETIKAAIQG